MKARRIMGVVVAAVVLTVFASCSTVGNADIEKRHDEIGIDITVEVKSFSSSELDSRIMNLRKRLRNDKSLKEDINKLDEARKANWAIEDTVVSAEEKKLESMLVSAAENSGYEIIAADAAIYAVNGNLAVRYGYTDKGVLVDYSFGIEVDDNTPLPRDKNQPSLNIVAHSAIERISDIDTFDKHAKTTWYTNGTILMDDVDVAIEAVFDVVEHELSNSFIAKFF